MKITERLEAARLRAGAWLRERKEAAQIRKVERQAAALRDVHHNSRFWLLNIPAAATICAAVVEVYWALLFCIEATGHIDFNYQTSGGATAPWRSLWDFAFSAHWPVLLGLLCATVPIVMLSMVWLPVQFAMRGAGRMRRGTIIAVGLLANALVIVSGTVVMNYNRQDQVRGALVVEQRGDASRAAIQAQIDSVNGDLARLTDRRINNEYAATAANVGADAYQHDYMSPEALARSPEQRRDIIMRALGAARQADALRAQRTQLIGQLATAAPPAATQARVEDRVGVGLNTFAQYVEVYRPPFVALICTLIGIFGAWWVVAILEGLNPRDVLRSGWASEAERIEDLRAQAPVAAEPMKPAREVVTDAETGEELVKVKPHWRKLKKGKKVQVDVTPEPQPDERGVETDGGERLASPMHQPVEEWSASQVPDLPSPEPAAGQQEPRTEQHEQPEGEQQEAVQNIRNDVVQPEPPAETYTEADLAAFEEELAPEPPVVTPDEPEEQNDSGEPHEEPAETVSEGEEAAHDEPQPETREERMLPAPESVAAE